MNHPIFLIGFMGAGKTTVGQLLAEELGVSFLDSDQEIEKQVGQPIAEIFSDKGEEGFREIESNWIENYGDQKAVIALGGGAFCSDRNREWIHKFGTSIYIKVSLATITERLMQDQTIRPLIANEIDDKELLIKRVEDMLRSRESDYNQAMLVVDGDHAAFEVAALILDRIQN
ncbi:MAG: shikimate kinase [Crocinitomicaceae bacterium]